MRTKNSKKKKFIKYGLLAVLILPIVIFTIFIYKTNAPLKNGEVEFHIPYKQATLENELTLDIYHPTSEQKLEKYPVLMYIHGGGWISGNKLTVNNNRFNGAINRLREAGYFVISPNYTLAEHGKTPFPNCIEDIFDALQWVEKHTDTYKFDLSRLGLLGESAGGHLAMMVSFSSPEEFGLNYNKTKIQYLIDVYGPSDLNELYNSEITDTMNAMIEKMPTYLANRLDPSRLLLGFNPEEKPIKTEKMMREFSPINYLDSEKIPTLIIHGKADQVVPVEQSYQLTKRFDSLGVEYEAHYFPGVNHAFYEATEEQKSQIQNLIVEFVMSQD